MGGWGSWALLEFPELRSLCVVVGVAGARWTLVHAVAWVVPIGEMVSVGWGATMPVGITSWGVMGASISWRAVQTAVVVGRTAQSVPSTAAASVVVWMWVGLWSTVMPMFGTIIWVWSVPTVVGIYWCLEQDLPWWHGVPDGGILWGQS